MSFAVFPLFQHGIAINYDRKIVDQHWIKFEPIYYKIEDYKPSLATDLMHVRGYGFRLEHKYFPYCNTGLKLGLFLSYGPSFQTFSIETKGQQAINFDKYGFECVIGFRKTIGKVFFFEFYGGLATDYLKDKSEGKVNYREVLRQHDQMWFDYGVAGNYMVLGLNMGVLF